MKTLTSLISTAAVLAATVAMGCSQAPRLDVETSPKTITVDSERELKKLIQQFNGDDAKLSWMQCRFDVDKDYLKDTAFYAGSDKDMICSGYYVIHSSELDPRRRKE